VLIELGFVGRGGGMSLSLRLSREFSGGFSIGWSRYLGVPLNQVIGL